MFENLCYFNGTTWHGISYKGGGLSTHHGEKAQIEISQIPSITENAFRRRESSQEICNRACCGDACLLC